jgi:glycine hydroxymethyltransferase
MTTRGFKEIEAAELANLVADVLDAPGDDKVITRVAGDVQAMCAKFPVYGEG